MNVHETPNLRSRISKTEHEAKQRLSEAAEAIRHRRQSILSDPRKLFLARVALGLLTVLVLVMAIRGFRSGIDRISGSSSSSFIPSAISNLFSGQDRSFFGTIFSHVPLFGRYGLFTSWMPWAASSWMSSTSSSIQDNIESGYHSLKESIDDLANVFQGQDVNSPAYKAYEKLKKNFESIIGTMLPNNIQDITPDSLKDLSDASYKRLVKAAKSLSESLGRMQGSFGQEGALQGVAKERGDKTFETALESARKFADLLSEGSGARVKKIGEKVKANVKEGVDGDRDDLVDAYEHLSHQIQNLQKEIEQRGKDLKDKDEKELSAADKALLTAVRTFSDVYDDFEDAFLQRNILQKIAHESKRILKGDFTNGKEAFDYGYQKLKGIGKKVGGKSNSAASKAYSAFEEQISKISDSFSNVGSSQPSFDHKVRATLDESYNALLRAVGKNPTVADDISDAYHSILQSLGLEKQSRLERLKSKLSKWF